MCCCERKTSFAADHQTRGLKLWIRGNVQLDVTHTWLCSTTTWVPKGLLRFHQPFDNFHQHLCFGTAITQAVRDQSESCEQTLVDLSKGTHERARQNTEQSADPNDVAIVQAAERIATTSPTSCIAIASTDTDFLESRRFP